MGAEKKEVLRDRFELRDELGRGAQGVTWLGFDRQTERPVAIKELDLARADRWKALELFEREAEALGSLDHPGIPAFVDSFHVEGEDQTRFFLVQEYIDGVSLRERLEAAGPFDEEEAREFMEAMLDVLAYMHGLSPPVVHRDLKPSNILRRPDHEGSDGAGYALIDFGGVQTILPETVGGSTVVGTSGYMPPEQLMGRAKPASDIYALAATVVQLLSGADPSELPVERMRLKIREAPGMGAVPEPLVELLEAMLTPAIEKRLGSAETVLEALRGESEPEWVPPGGPSTESASGEGGGDEGGKGSALVPASSLETALTVAREDRPPRTRSILDITDERLELELPPVDIPGANYALFAGAAFLTLSFGCTLIGAVVGFFALKWLWPYIQPEREKLILDGDGLRYEKIRKSPFGGSEKTVERERLSTSQLYLPHAFAWDIEQVERDPGDMFKAVGSGVRPGLVFEDEQGNSVTFGTQLFTQKKIIHTNVTLPRELEWLEETTGEYLKYLRGGANDEK